jgi:hypothetical protein
MVTLPSLAKPVMVAPCGDWMATPLEPEMTTCACAPKPQDSANMPANSGLTEGLRGVKDCFFMTSFPVESMN